MNPKMRNTILGALSLLGGMLIYDLLAKLFAN